jgi:hypothetical protein
MSILIGSILLYQPRGFLEKHLSIFLLGNDRNHLCLEYQSAKDYDYNWTPDWSSLIAKLLASLIHRHRSPIDANVKEKDGLG